MHHPSQAGAEQGSHGCHPTHGPQTVLPGGRLPGLSRPSCIPLLQSPGLPTNLGKKRSNAVLPHPAPPSPPTLSSSSTPSPTPNYSLHSSWDLSPVSASPGSTEPGPRASRSLGLPRGPWLRVHRALRIPFPTRKPPKGKSPRHQQAWASCLKHTAPPRRAFHLQTGCVPWSSGRSLGTPASCVGTASYSGSDAASC